MFLPQDLISLERMSVKRRGREREIENQRRYTISSFYLQNVSVRGNFSPKKKIKPLEASKTQVTHETYSTQACFGSGCSHHPVYLTIITPPADSHYWYLT